MLLDLQNLIPKGGPVLSFRPFYRLHKSAPFGRFVGYPPLLGSKSGKTREISTSRLDVRHVVGILHMAVTFFTHEVTHFWPNMAVYVPCCWNSSHGGNIFGYLHHHHHNHNHTTMLLDPQNLAPKGRSVLSFRPFYRLHKSAPFGRFVEYPSFARVKKWHNPGNSNIASRCPPCCWNSSHGGNIFGRLCRFMSAMLLEFFTWR